MKKKPLIFISHSSKNKDQVAKIADLLRSINLSPRRDIFCSSLPGYGIPNGANIFDFLRERFLNYDLHIIFVHSPEYYESPVSLNAPQLVKYVSYQYSELFSGSSYLLRYFLRKR